MAGTRITATATSTKALAAVAVLALGAGVAMLARVDGLGPATGPDRTMRWLGATTSPTDVQVARASEVLAQRPIDGRAYRVLAMAKFAAGEREAGDTLLAIANRRWPRDPLARAMSAERAFALGDANTALEHIDAWMRIEPGTRREVLALLMPQLRDARVRDALVARANLDPPWRGALFDALRAPETPAADADALVLALAHADGISGEEALTRVVLLDRQGDYAHAREIWRGHLSTVEAGRADAVYDGGFEQPGVAGGYGWRFASQPGIDIVYDETTPRAGLSTLRIGFGGRAEPFGGVSQYLALQPGRYRLQASVHDNVESTRPFEWRVRCRDDGREIGRLVLRREGSSVPMWRTHETTFEVPSGCTGQTLALVHAARSLAERRLSGTLSVDDVGIFLIR